MQAQRTLNSVEIEKLKDKIKDIRIAMLTGRCGFLRMITPTK